MTDHDDGRDRAGDGTDRAGDGTDRAGDGQDRAGDGQDRAGDGTDRAGDGTDRAGDGTAAAAFAELQLPGQRIRLPVVEGSEGERAIDLSGLRDRTGYITLDPGYVNTGSCRSAITFVDGERGILRYRGYPVEQLAEQASFAEVALLLLHGKLPSQRRLDRFNERLTEHALLHEGMRHHFEGFPNTAHPMAIMSAMINALSAFRPELLRADDEEHLVDTVAFIMSKVRTIAAFGYKKSRGEPIAYPDPARGYCESFLNMMFSRPHQPYDPLPEVLRALQMFLILHADHEQNCSTSTARMVGSSGANLYASVAAAVCALWGRLHGGANAQVIAMLEEIQQGELTPEAVLERAKRKEIPLYGFGHRLYRNHDPRVRGFKRACDELFSSLGTHDPLLDIARELEERALEDDYFVSRKLYPNLDFYSGILLRALGIPRDMFTVMFAIGRTPGWCANWAERWHRETRIHRPRQIYDGPRARDFTPLEERG
jgi:citrate synthase